MMFQFGTGIAAAYPAVAQIDGQAINLASQADALRALTAAARGRAGFSFFTLNLDHLVKRRADAAFRAAYTRATFVSADGAPVVRLCRREAPQMQRATGADIIGPLCAAAAAQGLRLYLFGSTQSSLDQAAAALRARYSGLVIAGAEAPAFGFDPLSAAADAAADRIAASGAHIALIALGAPKQEIFADHALARCPRVGFACIGAALDFISGEQGRAPRLFRATGMEWLWRLAGNPRRLAARYWQCALLLSDLAVVMPLRQRLHGVKPELSL